MVTTGIPLANGRVVDLSSTVVMGVLNRTPDSFHPGSRLADADDVLRAAERMVGEGADLLDIGGESSRPGATPVSPEEEIRRVAPAIASIRRRLAVPISVDTVRARVARAALDAGADMVNDISALADPGMAALAADRSAPVVLMHMRGTPRTMQADTGYADVVDEIAAFLVDASEKAIAAGIRGDRIVLDPGIGFGKSVEGNLEILRRLPELSRLGRPLLVGASRKSFIGKTLDLPVDERLEGSLAVAAMAAWLGARLIRAHDVRETVRVVRMVDAVRRS